MADITASAIPVATTATQAALGGHGSPRSKAYPTPWTEEATAYSLAVRRRADSAEVFLPLLLFLSLRDKDPGAMAPQKEVNLVAKCMPTFTSNLFFKKNKNLLGSKTCMPLLNKKWS